MKKQLLPLALVLGLCGCAATLDASMIVGSVEDVTLRHNAYVSDDPNLDTLEKEVYLNQANELRKTVREAADSE